MNPAHTSIPFTPLLALMMAGSGGAFAAGERHADPLQIISGRNTDPVPVRKQNRPRSPGHHYSPLDALNGKIIVKEKSPSGEKTATTSTSLSTVSDRKATETPTTTVIHLDVKPQTDSPTKTDTRIHLSPAENPSQPTEEVDGMILPPQNVEEPLQSSDQVPTLQSDEPDSEIMTEAELKALLETPLEDEPETEKLLHHTVEEKTLYLTFDDGPVGGSANLLHLLKEENIEATLFYIGREVLHNPKLFRQALSMPNVLVANHTYAHANNHYRRFYNSSSTHVVRDIDRAQKAIGGAQYMRLCGRNVWRLPSARRNDRGIGRTQRKREIPKYDALYRHGYFIYGWDVEWAFSHKTQRPLFSGKEMARRVNHAYRSGHTLTPGKVVLLAHDFMFRSRYNVAQLRTFIHIMKEQGWQFRTIDDYSSHTPGASAKSDIPKISDSSSDMLHTTQSTVPVPENTPVFVHAENIRNAASQLSDAIRKQSFKQVRHLLARSDIDINQLDPQGNLPLNLAIRTNNAVLVQMLIERGAQIFHLDAEGMSPMGVAREENNIIIVHYLRQQIRLQKERRLHQTIYARNENIY